MERTGEGESGRGRAMERTEERRGRLSGDSDGANRREMGRVAGGE